MQTFLPYANFTVTAKVLDDKRLGKQRVEVLQLLATISGKKVIAASPTPFDMIFLAGAIEGYKNHPCTKMWRKHLNALVTYGMTICEEWINRGNQDTCLERIVMYREGDGSFDNPRWLGDERLHSNHRARLLAKDPVWYGVFGWKEQPIKINFWPLESRL